MSPRPSRLLNSGWATRDRSGCRSRSRMCKAARQLVVRTPDELPRALQTSVAFMRVCLVFDCLYPHTVGGAERWYRNLAENVARRGHSVTYLTLLQWDPRHRRRECRTWTPSRSPGERSCTRTDGEHRRSAAVRLRRLPASAAPRRPLRRRADASAPPLAAGGARGAAVPAVLARRRLVRGLDARVLARLPGRGRRPPRLVGTAGLGAGAAPRTCFSRRHARRLEEMGYSGEITLLEGLLLPGWRPPSPRPPSRWSSSPGV